MNKSKEVIQFISGWLKEYAESAKVNGFIIGISGGIDSAVTSTLCALTGKKVLAITLPIRQTKAEFDRANEHIDWMKQHFPNVESLVVDLTETFTGLEATLPKETATHFLAMANTRSRLRMTTLYALAQANNLLVAGTGNKVEDFGVGFFTKYGDGGVDLSPIADLFKTEVFALANELDIIRSIQTAAPTDGLWEDGRSDEDQIGATYPELEWAMEFRGDEAQVTTRQKEVLAIYRSFNSANKHKMNPIPVCLIPDTLRS
jgi:NAD+ synthase